MSTHPIYYRKLSIVGVILVCMSAGAVLGYPIVRVCQMRKHDFIRHDLDMASWIGLLHGLASVPTIAVPLILHYTGNEVMFIAASLIVIVGWILAYLARSTIVVFVCEWLQNCGVELTTLCHGTLSDMITIVVSPQLAALSVGGAVTYPTLLMERFRANDTSIKLDMDTRSWIGSIYGFAGIPAILMPIITQKIGRKWGYITTCFYMIIGWILAYTATSATELFISESFHGLGTNSLLPVSFLGMTEMLAPKYRATSMQTFGIAQGVGMAACGILGRYLHYKTISLIMIVPILCALAIALLWPESPSWFAWKGEFDKCERAFIKLRGSDDRSERELKELIAAQKENFVRTQEESFTFKGFWNKISSRDFYMPSLHMFAIFLMMYWSGCDVVYIYFIEIVTMSSNNANAAFYGGIAMYVIVLSGLIITNLLLRKFENKTVLKISTCGVIAFSFLSFLVSSLQTMDILGNDSLLLLVCLIGYIAFASFGLNGIVFFIAAELMPVKHRSLGGALFVIINCILYASSMKLSPYISLYIGLWCTFLIYTINASFGLWFVWKFLPETSGRSMQEIEDYYTFGHFVKRCVDDNEIESNGLVA